MSNSERRRTKTQIVSPIALRVVMPTLKLTRVGNRFIRIGCVRPPVTTERSRRWYVSYYARTLVARWNQLKHLRDQFYNSSTTVDKLGRRSYKGTSAHRRMPQGGGALKLQEWTMQEWTRTEDVAGMDIAGVDNDGGSCRG